MTAHETTQHLLPWYVNGTLEEQEMVLVSDHLADCAECQQAMAAEIALGQRLQPTADDAAALAALNSRAEQSYTTLKRRLAPAASTTRQRPIAAAVIAVLLLLSFGVGRFSFRDNTLQGMTVVPPASATPAQLTDERIAQVIFGPAATGAEIAALLGSVQGHLLGPATSKGVYRLAIRQSSSAAHLRELQANAAVLWIGWER